MGWRIKQHERRLSRSPADPLPRDTANGEPVTVNDVHDVTYLVLYLKVTTRDTISYRKLSVKHSSNKDPLSIDYGYGTPECS